MNMTRSCILMSISAFTFLTQACNSGPEIRVPLDQLTEENIFHRGEIKNEKHCYVLINGKRTKVKFGKLDSYGDKCVGAFRLAELGNGVELWVKYVSYFRSSAGTLKARVITTDGNDVTFKDAIVTYGSDNAVVDGLGHQYMLMPGSVDGESIVGKEFMQVDVPPIPDGTSGIVATDLDEATVEPTAQPTAVDYQTLPQASAEPTAFPTSWTAVNKYSLDDQKVTAQTDQVPIAQSGVPYDPKNPYDCIDSFGNSVPYKVIYGNRWLCMQKGFTAGGNPYFYFYDFVKRETSTVVYDIDTRQLDQQLGINPCR